MTDEKIYTGKVAVAANQFTQERDYWLNKLSGDLIKNRFTYDFPKAEGRETLKHAFTFTGELFEGLMKLSNGFDPRLHMILVTAVTLLLNKYTGNQDIILGAPIYKQETEGEFVNTAVALRNSLNNGMTFKDLLLQVRETITEADKNQGYPVMVLAEKLGLELSTKEFPLFDVVVMVENIQEKKYLEGLNHNV
ncbi:MAG: hypothetical protein GY757_38875, partial [bacterium]|nr:hypothetical protein [bacterium]